MHLIEDDIFLQVYKEIYDAIDDDVRDTCGKIKAGKEYDEADIVTLKEREERQVAFIEKTTVPAVFAERVSEDIAEKTAEEKDAAGSKCQVQPHSV